MPTDRIYTTGGANATNGNYARTNGLASRVLRLLHMWRGYWPGSRGVAYGMDWDAIHAGKFETAEEAAAFIRRQCETALRPLVDSGEIAINDIEAELVTDSAAGFYLHYTDLTTNDSISQYVSSGVSG